MRVVQDQLCLLVATFGTSCYTWECVNFSHPQRVSHWQSAYRGSLLSTHQIFIFHKMMNCSTVLNFARSLTIPRWRTFGRFTRLLATMPWATHKLRSGTISLKMIAHQWTAICVLEGPQEVKMMRSTSKG